MSACTEMMVPSPWHDLLLPVADTNPIDQLSEFERRSGFCAGRPRTPDYLEGPRAGHIRYGTEANQQLGELFTIERRRVDSAEFAADGGEAAGSAVLVQRWSDSPQPILECVLVDSHRRRCRRSQGRARGAPGAATRRQVREA